ncbi:MAG: TonB-dependent receptor [Micavibrio sp.]|nr:TonB-dependent receptor [Micavibrio sp.]
MRGNFLCLLFVLTILSLGTLSAHAQSASVSGQVVDASGALVPNMQITLINTATNTAFKTKTNNVGIYNFPFVKPGKYSLVGDNPGFSSYTENDITVTAAQALELDFRVQVGANKQSVTVSAYANNEINTTDATVSTVVDREFVENIPLNGRSFQSLMTMIPGVSVVTSNGVGSGGEMTVNGQRTEANYFTVDGVSANTGLKAGTYTGGGYAGSVPGETTLGTTQSIVSIDALQEFRATTSSYSAEYGRTPGGQFIFQTRSGTNEWHGTVFDYFRNNALDANNYFNKRTSPVTPRQVERQNDFGGTFAGPLRIPHLYNGKDRTFFFFSYEGLRLIVPTAATLTSVPSLSLRQNAPAALRPFLNAFPLPTPGTDATGSAAGTADYTAGWSSPSSLDTSSIRVDHHFSDKVQAFFRYSDSSSDSSTRANGSGTNFSMATITTQSGDTKTATAGVTNIFTPRFDSDLRFNYTSNASASNDTMDNFGGATPLTDSYLDTVPGFSTGKTLRMIMQFGNYYPEVQFKPFRAYQHQINVVETMNYSIGRHKLKWGVDYRRLSNYNFLTPMWEQGIYNNQSQVLTNQSQGVAFYISKYSAKPVYDQFSLFLQDEWKVTSRLNASLGVRWELNPAPHDADGHDPYAVTTTNLSNLNFTSGPLWKTTYGNFAPRFAAAYQAHQTPGWETVIRAGGGLFYDLGASSYASNEYQGVGFQSTGETVGAAFPFTQAQIDAIPAPSLTPPWQNEIYAIDPNLKLPYTWQWNVAVEQSLGRDQTLTLSYVGSAGRRLMKTIYYNATQAQKLNANMAGGLNFSSNGSLSNYDSFQLQFQRKMSHGLQALASYTWAHARDNGTSNNWGTAGLMYSASDYDIRSNFQLGLRYEVPGSYNNLVASAILKHWAFDARVTSRSALPLNILGTFTTDINTGVLQYQRPNRVQSQPLYKYGSQYPGGRIINYSAFQEITDANGNNIDGDVSRNYARSFGATQADLALNRTFPLWNSLRLQFRAEAFNVLNQAVMGNVKNTLSSGDRNNGFGYASNTLNGQLGGLNSLYQVGGPRSLQLALKLQF